MRTRILIQTLALNFFRKYIAVFAIAGFFIITIRKYEHEQVARAIMADPFAIGSVLLFWMIYVRVAYSHCRLMLSLKENRFLTTLIFRKRTIHFIKMLKVQAVYLLPLLIYSVFLFAISSNWRTSLILGVFLLVAFLFPGWRYYHFFLYPYPYRTDRKQVRIKVKKPSFTWPLIHILNEKPILFLLVKLCALGIVVLTSRWDSITDYDERWWLMGMLLSISISGFLIFDMFQYIKSYKVFYRSIPIPTWKRYLTHFTGVMLLTLPEAIMLVRYFNYQREIWILLLSLLFIICYGQFLWSMAALGKDDIESYMVRLLVVIFSVFLTILFGLPGVIVCGILLLLFFVISLKKNNLT